MIFMGRNIKPHCCVNAIRKEVVLRRVSISKHNISIQEKIKE
jgi:hypothetical protein